MPWTFDNVTGKLQHFLADLQGNVATKDNFEHDAKNFEKSFARDVRFLSSHCHDHECSGTCVKHVKTKGGKTGESEKVPPCRFDFFHTVTLTVAEKLKQIRRRGKEIVDVPCILSTTLRNQFGLVALERPQPFRSAFSDCGVAALRCNNDFKFMPRGFAN